MGMATAFTGSDPVNSPDHYTNGEIECIDAIRAALGPDGFRAFCQGQVIKYSWRAQHKGDWPQDFQKATWYSRMAIGDDPRVDRERQDHEPKNTSCHDCDTADSLHCQTCTIKYGSC